MKKKELKKRIKHLQELTDCLISDNVRLMMRLGEIKYNYDDVEIPKFGTCTQEEAKGTILERTKEPESKEQNDKRREIYEAQRNDRYSHINDAFDAMACSIFEKGLNYNEAKCPKQTMTSFPDIPAATPSQVEEAERRIFAKIAKTEGPESESELKENTISLEVGKKYEAGNGEILRCNQYDERNNLSQKYEMSSKYGRLYYSKEGRNCGCDRSWDIVSEVKE